MSPGLGPRLVLGLVLPLAMAFLVITLTRSCNQGKTVIGGYLDSVRKGSPVTEAVGGAEAPRLTPLLRGSRSFSVDNFQGQHGTSCYWIDLNGERGSTEVRVVLGSDDTKVVAVSAARECQCPEDADEPCGLVD